MNREVSSWGKKAEHSLLKAALGQPVTVNGNRCWCCIYFTQWEREIKDDQGKEKKFQRMQKKKCPAAFWI